MRELNRNIGYSAPTCEILSTIAQAAGVLASAYYRLIRTQSMFTAYSIDVQRNNSRVSSGWAREEIGFLTRHRKVSIHYRIEWFRSEGILTIHVD